MKLLDYIVFACFVISIAVLSVLIFKMSVRFELYLGHKVHFSRIGVIVGIVYIFLTLAGTWFRYFRRRKQFKTRLIWPISITLIWVAFVLMITFKLEPDKLFFRRIILASFLFAPIAVWFLQLRNLLLVKKKYHLESINQL